MAKQVTEPIPKHRVLREVLRHYMEYRDLITSPQKSAGDTNKVSDINSMDGVIEHGYWVYPEDGGERYRERISISFWDLHRGITELSPRKREALFYNVILDWKQRDVAERMGITTVSVGQYVEQACLQLAELYFAEEEND